MSAWYKQSEEKLGLADGLMKALKSIERDSQRGKIVEQFAPILQAKMIFESNLIEGAGEQLGQTQRIVQEYFPTIPAQVNVYQELIESKGGVDNLFSRDSLKLLKRIVKSNGANPKVVTPSIKFEGKSKSFKEVAQHNAAITYAQGLSTSYSTNKTLRYIRKIARDKEKDASTRQAYASVIKSFLEDIKQSRIRREKLLTTSKLLTLHRIIASRLLPPDCKTKAGKYRVEDITVPGANITFTPWTLLGPTMKRFLENADNVLDNCKSFSDYQIAAARISHEFVKIHPFPDFNGRLSRIIMNMILWSANPKYELCVAIRGDGKNKRKYFMALDRANNGDFRALTTIVAEGFISNVDELDRHFSAAGLKTIRSEASILVPK